MIPTFLQYRIISKVDALITACCGLGAGPAATFTSRRPLEAPLAEREMEVIQ